MLSFPKFDLFQQPEYLRAQAHAAEYATSPPIINHYGRYICLKPLSETGSRPSTHRDTIETAFKQIEPFITNTLDEITGKIENKLCILPKGHSGKCMSKCHNNLFKRDATAAAAAASTRFGTKIDQAIYTTPGNDGIIYKNRHDRGFPIVVSSANERLIKEYERALAAAAAAGTVSKRSCAIPLCERSTPLMMATAYIDFMSYLLNIQGIDEYLTPDENLSAQEKEMIAFLQNTHKLFLDTFYRGYNRRIFTDRSDGGSGFTRCAVRRYTFTPRDFVDTTRDSRFDISQNDIQIGHIVSRSDSEYTIRGLNVLFMSRRGNLIIGEENYLEEGWRDTLRGCLE